MSALSTSHYADNLRAVGAVAVGLQQSISALHESIGQLLSAVQGAADALTAARASVQKANRFVADLQSVFKKSGLEAGQESWRLLENLPTSKVRIG